MIAPDPLDWLRSVLREREDVKSVEVSLDFKDRLIVLLTDGETLAVRVGRAHTYDGGYGGPAEPDVL